MNCLAITVALLSVVAGPSYAHTISRLHDGGISSLHDAWMLGLSDSRMFGSHGGRAFALLEAATCQRMMFRNGRAVFKEGRREMRFKCHRGFRRLGDQYAICVRGRWNVQPPVCAKGGCDVVPDPANGMWHLSMSSAVATLVCDPGYTLSSSISSQIYCDGLIWRPRRFAPTCRALIVSPKSSCDFESEDICGWSQDSVTDFLWIRNNYSTPSGHLKTGPSFDHTYGSGFGGHYMFIESSSPRKENDFARLYSPVFSKDLADDGCFMFWYNMFGTTIGSLMIYVKLESQPFKELTPSFQKSGNQGARWIQGIIPLTSINETFQVIIEATRGNGFLGDIAVDDVALRKGDDCVVIPDQPITAAIRQEKTSPPSGPSTKTIVAVVAVVLTALLCSIVGFFFVKKRLRLRRQRNVAEDSDVRYLTSDEILDFNMARPADEDT